jgi:hypothetical protein
MTQEQKKIVGELAEFAPTIKGRCKDFHIAKSEAADLMSYLEKNSYGKSMVPGFILMELPGIEVFYRTSHDPDFYYVKVAIKRKMK